MLRTTKNMKEKYEQIQNYLFTLIPEKWEEIYLYASVVLEDENNNMQETKNGEMFFYYLPKGILKKRAINVYEVPQRFNINEDQYLKIVDELYECIKGLKQDFIDTEQDLWTNLTISIANYRFKVEYQYDTLPVTDKEIKERDVIWKYKYLKIGGENKEEQIILNQYFLAQRPIKKETYETGVYIKADNNSIEFGKEDVEDREFIMYQKEDLLNIKNNIKNKFFGNSGFSKEIKQENFDTENQEKDKEKKHSRNQILDN